MELAQKIAASPPIAVKLTKYQLHKGLELSLENALILACDAELLAVETKDHIEAAASFVQKRTPVFKGE